MSKGYLQSMWGQGKKVVLFFDNWDEVTPSTGPLAVVPILHRFVGGRKEKRNLKSFDGDNRQV